MKLLRSRMCILVIFQIFSGSSLFQVSASPFVESPEVSAKMSGDTRSRMEGYWSTSGVPRGFFGGQVK